VPAFIYASSSSVYGNTPNAPFDEHLSTPEPINYYGGTKLANEILVSSSIARTNSAAVGLRLFTVYGPYGRPDMAYMKILSRNLFGSDFQLFGDGSALRDFTYIDDVVQSISLLEEKMKGWQLGTSTVVNIGGGQPRRMSELIEIMNHITKYKFTTIEKNEDPLDMKLTVANTSYLEKLIGFKPSISLEIGADNLISWAMDPEINQKLSHWLK
jgi:UDP-glucuronate 4-epimerase